MWDNRVFPKGLGKRIAEAEGIRHNGDYDDFYLASKEETMDLAASEELLKLVKQYIEEQDIISTAKKEGVSK